MENDDDLTRLLAQAADPPPATSDSFRDVMDRYRKGRTRVLLAALAAVALLGPAVGVAVGRATADHPVQVATGASPDATGQGQSGSGSAGSGSTESRSVGSASGGSVSSGGSSPAPSLPSLPKRLFVRTTADGVTIRAYLQENLPGPGEVQCTSDQGSVPCPKPPPECAPPTTQLQAGLSDDGAIDPGSVPVNTTDTPGPLTVLQSSYFGAMEGDPAAWVAVKADAGVARVRVRFADAATDEMVPVDGYAVLAHRMAAPARPTQVGPASSPEEANAQIKALLPQGSAEALDASGAVLSTADLASVTGPFSPQCMIKGDPSRPPMPPEGIVPPASAAPPVTVAATPATAPPTSRP